MNNYVVEISKKFFDSIEKKEQAYIILVNNSKVRDYHVGNILTIKNKEDTEQNFEAEVINLLYFDEINDIFGMVKKKDLGFSERNTNDQVEDKLLENVKYEDVEKYGVVMVEIKKK